MLIQSAKVKAAFYKESAFRYKEFVAATVLILLDVALFGIVLAKRWVYLPSEVVYLLVLGIAGLLLLWGMVLSQQRSMLREFSRGAVAQEPGPACEIALWVASNISIRGLFFAGVSVGALLQVAFKLSRPH
jgi:hypothetical protein